MKINYFTCE